MNNKSTVGASILLLANAALAAPPLTEPVDANIVNTVDARIVNTISADSLGGVDLSPTTADSITVFFVADVSIQAISTSIAPVAAGDLCNLSIGVKSDNAAPSFAPLGLSVLSNGQAATASTNFEIPLEGVKVMDWGISGPSGGCVVSLSVSYTEIATQSDAGASGAGRLGMQDQVRIEVR